MIEIIPALMPKTLEELHQQVGLFSGHVPLVQIDIMDGVFVPNRSWPFMQGGQHDIDKIIREEEGLPHWETVDFELDLMVRRPDRDIMKWMNIGARRIIFHYASLPDLSVVTTGLDPHTREYVEIGIALDMETPLDVIEPWLDDIDFVQLMGIAHIGYQGEPFDENVLEKIEQLHGLYPDVIIAIDGGVRLDNVRALIEAGASRLAVGSALLASGDILGTLNEFQSIASEY
jgi:ribulose-phosphate 3-epimerase